MRIASLVPSSTEMLFALGLGDDVVGVTHECDYPPEAASLPHLTRSVIPEGLTAADIDRAVRERTEAVEGAPGPTVAALEWLDPVFAGGHWVPQMVELAGGFDLLGLPGEKSRIVEWSEVEAARPELVVSMPCGYDTERAAHEAEQFAERLAALRARVVAVDAAAYFSRPGPRLVDGVELLAHLMHPTLVEAPPAERWRELDLRVRA